MNLKAFKKIEIEDYKTSKMFENVNEFLNQLMPNPFMIGNVIDVTVLTTATQITHGLGQVPIGFMLLDITANATVWRVSSTDKFITLQASASCPVKIWVF